MSSDIHLGLRNWNLNEPCLLDFFQYVLSICAFLPILPSKKLTALARFCCKRHRHGSLRSADPTCTELHCRRENMETLLR